MPGPLRTPRLLVRLYEQDDAPALFRAIEESRPHLLPWLPWARTAHRTEQDTALWLRQVVRSRGFAGADQFLMGIFTPTASHVLGGIDLHAVDPITATAEVGYWIHAAHRRKGFATEALLALAGCAFGPWGLRRLWLGCAGSNRASQRVAEKAGFRLEGRAIQARWTVGVGWDDALTYAVLASEWPRPPKRPPASRP